MIQFNCSECNTKLSAPPGSEAGQCDCPKCGQRLTIPGDPPLRERVAERSGRPPVRDRREEMEEGEDYPRSSRRRGRFRCPYCDSDERPVHRSEISSAGWITFAILLVMCGPLCLIGLFIKEEYDVCRDCGRKV